MGSEKAIEGKGQTCIRRPFYPCNLRPLAAEEQDFKNRFKRFDDLKKEYVKKIRKFRADLHYVEEKQPFKMAAIVAGAGLILFLIALLVGYKQPYTQALLFGMKSSRGTYLLQPGLKWMILLGVQGALGLFGATYTVIRANRLKAKIGIDLFKEWTTNVDLKNDDLEQVVVPEYKAGCPFDPTQIEFELVIGEYYDNPGHKFGPEACWYTVPFKGLATGGTAVFGVTGSGKTAAVLKNFMRQYFSWMATISYDPKNKGVEKLAGLVLDPKGSLCAELASTLRNAGLDPVLDYQEAASGKSQISLSPLAYQWQADHVIQKYEEAIEAKEKRILFLENNRPDGFEEEIKKRRGQIAGWQGEMAAYRKRAERGEPIHFSKEVFDSYRGRADDYIELGFDEFKVKAIFDVLNKIQESKNAIYGVNEVKFSVDEYEQFDSHYVPSKAAIKSALNHMMIAVHNFVACIWVASERRVTLMRDYKDVSNAPENFVLKASVKGESGPGGGGKSSGNHSVGIMPGTIGNQDALDDMDAYANMRQFIRIIAPAKERPGEDVMAYRLRWLARETRLSVYSKNLKAVAEQIVDAANKVLMACGNDPKLSAFARDAIEFARMASSPMNDLLGPNCMVVEGRGIPKQEPSAELLGNLLKVKNHVPADVVQDIEGEKYHSLTVPVSDLPSPRPVDEDTRLKLGNAYSEPDPFVQCVEDVGQLKVKEKIIAGKIKKAFLRADVLGEFKREAIAKFRSRILTGFGSGLMNFEDESDKVEKFLKGIEGFIADDIEGVCLEHMSLVLGAEITAYPTDWAYKKADLREVSRAYVLSRVNVETPEAAVPMLKECFDRAGRKLKLTKGGEPRPKTIGSGPMHGVLRKRYAEGVVPEILREISKSIGIHVQVDNLLKSFVSEVMVGGFLGLADRVFFEDGSLVKALEEGDLGLHRDILETWHSGRLTMKKIGDLFDGLVPESIQDKTTAALDGRDNESINDPEEELFFDPFHYASFWLGLADGNEICPAAVAAWDRAWSAVIFKRLSLALRAAPQDIAPWQNFLDFVAKYSEYHQQSLEMFSKYVAPNSGHRTNGPFMFNPLYLPGLDTANIAKTFVTAIFAATSKGGGKSDPFWENASNSLVTNLLTATKIAYGYTTFPIMADLIANKERLKNLMGILDGIQKRPDCTAEALQDIQNVLNWYNGQWERPGMDQGETKANIIATLSVTTQAFLAPVYQLAFAPQREEDISFPGWNWIFKHGKVVGVNLPIEKHPAVAQVVLPLLNKSFQKYIQLRDGERIKSAALKEDHGRVRIKQIDAARQMAIEQIRDKRAWHDVLGDLFKEDDYRIDKSIAYTLCHPTSTDHSDHSILNLLLTYGSVGTYNGRISLDKFLAFLVGITGKYPYKGYEWYKIDEGCRGAWNAGIMVTKCVEGANHFGFPSWSRVRLEEILETLKVDPLQGMDTKGLNNEFLSTVVLPRIQKAVSERWREVGFDWGEGQHLLNAYLGVCLSIAEIGEYDEDAFRNIQIMGGVEAMVELVGKLPMLTVMLQKDVFTVRVMEKMRQDYEVARAELNEGVLQENLSLINRVKDFTAQIRSIEDELAALPNTERWVVWMVDEAHFYLEGESDTQYASVSRSARALNCIATQSPAALYSRMEEKVCDALLANFPNRVILRQADFEEAETCANLLGGKKKMKTIERSLTHSFEEMAGGGGDMGGRGKGGGGSVSVNMKEDERYIVDPNLLVEIPALQAFALTWDGGRMREPRRVYMKPDFLFGSEEVRNYQSEKVKRVPKLPGSYPDGIDLFAVSVPRLMQLKVLDPSK